MKLDIKTLSTLLVLLNCLMLFGDLPKSMTLTSALIVALSFSVKNEKWRLAIKTVFLFSSLILIKILFKTFLVTEAGVSFVLVLSTLKLWELDNERDHFNMFLILALSECCLFLLSPTFFTFFLGLIKIIIFFYFILKIRNYDLSRLSFRRLLFLVAPSIVLSLLLFYTFPRFTQGFVNATNNQLLFSSNDTFLNFKNLGPLNPSSKPIFKVFGLKSIKYPIPKLYWRETILWDYFNDEWRTSYINLKSIQINPELPIDSYKIQLLKDYNEFLPTLDGVSKITQNNSDFNFYDDGGFKLRTITKSVVNYGVDTNSKSNYKELSLLMEKKGLRINSKKLDQIRSLILKDKPNASEGEKLELLIRFFKSRHYEYTLTPPTYNSIEEFILSGKSGYCSHFAASIAFMARAIGLPSRIVTGYQGGDYNPYDGSIIVRELDGHAWNEIFLEDKGWVRLDPTALVAPGRIELGASAFFEKVDPFINLYIYQLPKSFFKFKALSQFSFWIDSLNSTFNTNILSFDKDRQQEILKSIFPKNLPTQWIFVLILCLSMPLFGFILKKASTIKRHENEMRYLKFLKKCQDNGLNKRPEETISAFCLRGSQEAPELKDYLVKETAFYIDSFYKQ